MTQDELKAQMAGLTTKQLRTAAKRLMPFIGRSRAETIERLAGKWEQKSEASRRAVIEEISKAR